MIIRSIKRIADTLGSTIHQMDRDAVIKGVSIDSRTLQAGNMFVPIVRDKDGHDYVNEAIQKGAVAALWQSDHPNPPSNIPIILVDNCLSSLQLLAKKYREELPVKIVGVTGSNGKTTTKDMIHSILATTHKTYKTKGNLNSQIGLPLAILEIEEDTEFAVLEMGMSERGQIERLSKIAAPAVAVITMIGLSHLSALKTREGIASAKLEITSGLKQDGILIVHGDEPLLDMELPFKKVRFGTQRTNDYYPIYITQENEETTFITNRSKSTYSIPILGKHNVMNALASISVAEHLGIDPGNVRKGLADFQMTGMRMEKIETLSGFTIINDAWNASPNSMRAAIETFHNLKGYGKKILVLGDMLELGKNEQEYHRDIGRFINAKLVDLVYTIGELSKWIANEAQERFPYGNVQWFDSKEKIVRILSTTVKPGDIILFKGSRGMKLEDIVEQLR